MIQALPLDDGKVTSTVQATQEEEERREGGVGEWELRVLETRNEVKRMSNEARKSGLLLLLSVGCKGTGTAGR